MQKNQDQKSRGSKARAKINRQTDQRADMTECITLLANAVGEINYARSHKIILARII